MPSFRRITVRSTTLRLINADMWGNNAPSSTNNHAKINLSVTNDRYNRTIRSMVAPNTTAREVSGTNVNLHVTLFKMGNNGVMFGRSNTGPVALEDPQFVKAQFKNTRFKWIWR